MRKWQWIHNRVEDIYKELDETEGLKKSLCEKLMDLAKQIDACLMKAYPYAPTTISWEHDMKNHNLVTGKDADMDYIEMIALDSSYCVGCEMIDLIIISSSKLLEDACDYCRFGKIAGKCNLSSDEKLDPDLGFTNRTSLFGQFMLVLDEWP